MKDLYNPIKDPNSFYDPKLTETDAQPAETEAVQQNGNIEKFQDHAYSSLRTLVDGNQDVFRYGLHKYTDSAFEDPTYLGFTIELDETSSLFTDVLPFLEKYSSTRAEMQSRIPIYKEFISKVRQIFNSQESVREDSDKSVFIKQHYINSIAGLDNLTKKFNKWREDKLTIQLHEDIALFSSYLAHLYNNLVYSYENGRMIIPENLLKFKLYIKFSEVRNLTSISSIVNSQSTTYDKQLSEALKNNITCIVYKLFDCEFSFFESKPFEDTVAQAGIDTPNVPHSNLTLDIFFKSVSRQIYNPLIKNALAMNDNKVTLDVILVGQSGDASTNGQVTNQSGTTVGPNGQPYQKQEVSAVSKFQMEAFTHQSSKKPSSMKTYDIEAGIGEAPTEPNDLNTRNAMLNDMKAYNEVYAPKKVNDQFVPDTDDFRNAASPNTLLQDPLGALNDLTNKIKGKVNSTLLEQKRKANNNIRQKRNQLVRQFISDVEQSVGLKKIVPDNVYTNQDYFKNALEQIKSDIGYTVGDELISLITSNTKNIIK